MENMFLTCLQLHRPHTQLYPQLPCYTFTVLPWTSVNNLNTASPTSPPTPGHTETLSAFPCSLFVSNSQVKRAARETERGQEGVSPRVLKACVQQLCGVLQLFFSHSLSLEKVQFLGKISCPILVPQQSHPSAFSEQHPTS